MCEQRALEPPVRLETAIVLAAVADISAHLAARQCAGSPFFPHSDADPSSMLMYVRLLGVSY